MIALTRFDYLPDIAHQRLKKLLLALIDGLDLFKLASQAGAPLYTTLCCLSIVETPMKAESRRTGSGRETTILLVR